MEDKKLKPNEKILIEVFKIANLKDIFGSLKSGMSAQEAKDFAREGRDDY